ncbi:MAG TPA: cytochrome c peroxidase [Gemmatimonadales bacterium]
MTRKIAVTCFGLLALGVGCGDVTRPDPTPPLSLDADLRRNLQQWGIVPIGPMLPENAALVDLGRALVFDKILSGNRDISCGTCHLPSSGMTDGLSLAIGTGGTGVGASRVLGTGRQFVPRGAPSLLNTGLGLFYIFWDGRLSGFQAGPFQTPPDVTLPGGLPHILAAQAMFPVLNRREMRGEKGELDVFGNPNELGQLEDGQNTQIWQAVMARLLAIPVYVTKFSAAFPGVPTSQLRFHHAAIAIAAFQRHLVMRTDSPFDRYLSRNDAALTTEQKRGALLFFGRAQCSSCHNGPFLGGTGFANVGVPQVGPGVGAGAPLDLGRGELANNEFYRFAFRVVPLRNVELTAPYFHSGAYPTLDAVVRHYNDVPVALRGYDVSQLAPELRGMFHGDPATIDDILSRLDGRLARPLNLSDGEMGQVVAFLKALTDPAARDLNALIPATVPSGLPVQ